jgi:flagellar biosynthesis protein FlhB
VAFGALLAGTVAVLLQTGLLLSLTPLGPNLSRISLGAGLTRLLGSNGLIQALNSCAKIAVMVLIAWQVLAGDLVKLLAAPFIDPASLAARCVQPQCTC